MYTLLKKIMRENYCLRVYLFLLKNNRVKVGKINWGKLYVTICIKKTNIYL